MNLAEKIKLVTIEYTQNDIGDWEETRAETEVFAIIDSVTQNEFYQAGLQGFKPEYRFLIWQTEYSGQKIAEYDSKTYTGYRKYRRDDGRIELYVTERKGDEDNDTSGP